MESKPLFEGEFGVGYATLCIAFVFGFWAGQCTPSSQVLEEDAVYEMRGETLPPLKERLRLLLLFSKQYET